MPHPTKEEWLAALQQHGPDFDVVADNFKLKSPTFKLGSWRIGIEHQRSFEAVVVQWKGDVLNRPATPDWWIVCPPSDIKKGWEYRVYTRPEQLPKLLEELSSVPQSLEEVHRTFTEHLARSRLDTSAARLARLRAKSGRPAKVTVTSTVYLRDPDVVAEVLYRSKGVCEQCRQPAPFNRRSDGSPYLEVHHRIRLADGGDDTLENAVALCPNCHRKSHYA